MARWRILYSIFILSALVWLVYSNAFKADWQFDDYPNIVNNSGIRPIGNWNDWILNSLYANPINKDRLIRPVAYLTFAVNWYFGKGSLFGYHLVNVIIHISSACVLFLSICLLLNSPNSSYQKSPYRIPIALLAAVLWAIHPIQVQAVTYIVQRMTCLSGLFYIVGIYFYLLLKNTTNKINQFILCFGVILSYILALGTKEHTITLPTCIFVIEFIFYRDLRDNRTKKIALSLLLLFFLVSAILLLTVLRDPLLDILSQYDGRDFTLQQRLLTQPRILVMYLRQLFLPIDCYFSVVHDVPLSMSFVQPITTILAIVFILGLIVYGFRQISVRPFVALGILFFFVGHAVESTFIPLEMVFEHRNYLPSIFLFLPVAIGMNRLINNPPKNSKAIAMISSVALIILIASDGIATYNRNQVWSTEIDLWSDALKKAPLNPRPYQTIASIYKNRKAYRKALDLYETTLKLPHISNISQSKSLNNIGNIYRETGHWDLALRFYRESLSADQSNHLARLNAATALVSNGQFDAAMKHAEILFRIEPDNVRTINLYGFILYKQQRYKDALFYFRKGITFEPIDSNLLINYAMTLNHMGCFKNADYFLNLAIKYHGITTTPYFAKIQNLYISDNKNRLNLTINQLFSRFSLDEIQSALMAAIHNNNETPFNPFLVSHAIEGKIDEIIHEF